MKIIYFLIFLSFVVMFLSAYFFFWAVNNDQYDDLDSPAHHILFDDEKQK